MALSLAGGLGARQPARLTIHWRKLTFPDSLSLDGAAAGTVSGFITSGSKTLLGGKLQPVGTLNPTRFCTNSSQFGSCSDMKTFLRQSNQLDSNTEEFLSNLLMFLFPRMKVKTPDFVLNCMFFSRWVSFKEQRPIRTRTSGGSNPIPPAALQRSEHQRGQRSQRSEPQQNVDHKGSYQTTQLRTFPVLRPCSDEEEDFSFIMSA